MNPPSGCLRTGLALLCFLLFAGGCAAPRNLDTHIADAALAAGIQRVVVLPFGNESADTNAGTVACRIFTNELVASGLFHVEGEGAARLFFVRNRLLPGADIDSALYADLARQLKVDGVIRGKVLSLGVREEAQRGSVPYALVQVDLVEARTGRTILTTYHRRTGEEYRKVMHVGMVRTTSGLAAALSREIVEDWRHTIETGRKEY